MITIICSLIIGLTIGVILNYFILTKKNFINEINFSLKLSDNDDEEDTEYFETKMKIE